MMGRAARWLGLGAVMLTLAACGGGGGACVDGFGGTACAGGGGAVPTTAADLRIALSAVSLPNTTTNSLTATITAVDDGGVVVEDAPVTVSVDSGAEAVVNSRFTDANGQVAAVIRVGGNRANRIVTLTARVTGTAIVRTASFAIVDASLTATATAGIVAPGDPGAVTFRLVDAASNPIVGEPLTVTASGLATAEALTDNDGAYIYRFTAPATTGSLVITGAVAGTSAQAVVNVQSDSSSIPVVPAGSVLSATVSANPSVVSVNRTTTSNSSSIRALFVGADNARIANVRVRFELPTPNRAGDTLDSGSNIVYSDSNGFATTFFRPGDIPSPTNGVVVRVCWGYTDAELAGGACPRSTQTALTVVSDALRVDIGTDELVGLGNVTYTKDFVVTVVDAAGRAKADVEITPSIDLLGFYKGYYFWNGDRWQQVVTTEDGPYRWTGSAWAEDAAAIAAGAFPVCPNEDVNRNGVREDGEDLNGNSELDPSGVSITNVGSSRTDASGKAIVRIEYSRNRATWIDFQITVTAAVAGSEGKALYTGTLYGQGNLSAPGTAVSNQNVFPAFGISPYGRGIATAGDPAANLCSNTR